MLQFSNFQRCMVIGVNDERLAMKGSILLYLWALLMVEIFRTYWTPQTSHGLRAKVAHWGGRRCVVVERSILKSFWRVKHAKHLEKCCWVEIFVSCFLCSFWLDSGKALCVIVADGSRHDRWGCPPICPADQRSNRAEQSLQFYSTWKRA